MTNLAGRGGMTFDSAARKPRSGLAAYKLQPAKRSQKEICDPVISTRPILGFSLQGAALWECDNLEEAISVPDVALIRIREKRLDGLDVTYRFVRVVFKTFKVS